MSLLVSRENNRIDGHAPLNFLKSILHSLLTLSKHSYFLSILISIYLFLYLYTSKYIHLSLYCYIPICFYMYLCMFLYRYLVRYLCDRCISIYGYSLILIWFYIDLLYGPNWSLLIYIQILSLILSISLLYVPLYVIRLDIYIILYGIVYCTDGTPAQNFIKFFLDLRM